MCVCVSVDVMCAIIIYLVYVSISLCACEIHLAIIDKCKPVTYVRERNRTHINVRAHFGCVRCSWNSMGVKDSSMSNSVIHFAFSLSWCVSRSILIKWAKPLRERERERGKEGEKKYR